MTSNPSQVTIVKDLVLIGGGHSHLIVLKKFGMQPIPGVRVTLITRDINTPYSGLLPGYIAGHYAFDDMHIDLRPLCQFASARLYHDRAIKIDTENKKVICVNRPPISYDILSINIGSQPDVSSIPGASEFAIPVKPCNLFIDHWQQMLKRVLRQRGMHRIAVVGGGAAGVEMLLAMQFRLQQVLCEQNRQDEILRFHLISKTARILPNFPMGVSQRFQRILNQRSIHLHLGIEATRINDGLLRLSDGDKIELDEIFWITNASTADWLKESGLAVNEQGFMLVHDTLQSTSHADIFGAGDTTHVINHPCVKAGVFAVRQGKALYKNLRRVLLGQALKPFILQKTWLALISTGDKYAIATKAGLHFEGAKVWLWKDWIDRRFMRQFNRLPRMSTADVPMRCGGCGAKIEAGILSRTLADLKPVARDDILLGLQTADDTAVLEIPVGKVIVHTVDYFPAFIDDPYLFGQISAHHCLSDIFAMGAESQSALAIATIPSGIYSKTEDTLYQLMAGVICVLNDANTALVGGHSSEGAELALGISVNGFIDREHILRKAGMQVGDVLILTKPLGTGTLLAADKQWKAKGGWIEAALESMLLSNRLAAACFCEHNATACTDITGFGLLGHLMEMIRLSAVNVDIHLSALPLIEGAVQTAEMGILSTLQLANQRLQHRIKNQVDVQYSPLYPLIFDPQTSGGLLASLPAESANDCLKILQQSGYQHAAIIGRVTSADDSLQPVTLIQ